MNNVYDNIREMIGNTPIIKINHMGVKPGVNIYAKLELMNPAGSVKDRVGVYMIDDAKKRGLLKEGGIFILEHSGKDKYNAHPYFLQTRNYGKVNFTFFGIETDEE